MTTSIDLRALGGPNTSVSAEQIIWFEELIGKLYFEDKTVPDSARQLGKTTLAAYAAKQGLPPSILSVGLLMADILPMAKNPADVYGDVDSATDVVAWQFSGAALHGRVFEWLVPTEAPYAEVVGRPSARTGVHTFATLLRDVGQITFEPAFGETRESMHACLSARLVDANPDRSSLRVGSIKAVTASIVYLDQAIHGDTLFWLFTFAGTGYRGAGVTYNQYISTGRIEPRAAAPIPAERTK